MKIASVRNLHLVLEVHSHLLEVSAIQSLWRHLRLSHHFLLLNYRTVEHAPEIRQCCIQVKFFFLLHHAHVNWRLLLVEVLEIDWHLLLLVLQLAHHSTVEVLVQLVKMVVIVVHVYLDLYLGVVVW